MSSDAWKKKAEALDFANERLKEEAERREEQLTQIKARFASIVAELRKRELPDGLASARSGGGGTAAASRAEAELTALHETRVADLKKKVGAAQRAAQASEKEAAKWERKCQQLQRRSGAAAAGSGSAGPVGAATAAAGQEPRGVDAWKRRCKELQEQLRELQGGSTRARGGAAGAPTVRAVRPRRVDGGAGVAAEATGGGGGGGGGNPPLLLSAAEETITVLRQRSPSPLRLAPERERPVLMNAWSQTAQERVTTAATTSGSPKPRSLSPQTSSLRALGHQSEHTTHQNLIDALRRENLSLQCRLEEILDERNDLDSKLRLVVHERDLLLSKELDSCSAVDDIVELKRQLAEKNARLVLLDSRFTQAQRAVDSLKENQVELLREMERLNAQVSEAHDRALHAENALQVATLAGAKAEAAEDRLRERDDEVRLLNDEVARLMRRCHDARAEAAREARDEWERVAEERAAQLAEAERNGKKLFRDAQLLTQQRDEVHETWVRVQKERDALDTDVLRLTAENESLRERVRLFGPDHVLGDEDDVHKALALIQHHKRRGDPTDLEFLIKAWDAGDAEMGDLRAENVTLARELEIARKMLEARQQRIEMDSERLTGLRHAAEGKTQLLENMGDKLRRLTEEMGEYRGVGRRVHTDSDVDSVVAAEGENVLELSVAHVELARGYDCAGAAGATAPPTLFASVDFLDFETVLTEMLTGRSVTFARLFCFTVEVGAALRHYIQHKDVPLELHRAVGLGQETVASGRLSLRELLAPGCCEARGHVELVDDGGAAVATAEVVLKLQRPLPLDWVGLPRVVHEDKEVGLVYAFRQIRALKLTVHECRGLTGRAASAAPVPYVLVTAMSTVVTDVSYFGDLTVEMAKPAATRDPVFNFSHEYPVAVDAAASRYVGGAALNFVVLDDACLDAAAPPLGCASLQLSPLLDGTAATVDASLELTDERGSVAGMVVVSLRWIRSPSAQPMYVEGL